MTVLHGDCLEVMRTLPDASVDAGVTDPPYGLSFMGKDWDRGVPGVAFWREAFRLAKPGAHLLAFGGTRTHHRLVCAIEDAGWEIRDEIQWIFGSGFAKSHNLDGGLGTALKPAHEPICLARKPLVGTVAANVAEWGTGALNIDGCRVEANETLQGSTVRNDIRGGAFASGHKPNPGDIPEFRQNPLGRWPANLIHDGSPEVLAGFPEAGGGFGRRGGQRRDAGDYGLQATGETVGYGDAGSAARFFYCPKASKADRDDGLDGQRNHHPTVKPTDLMRYLCRLVTPPGGTVLDPFCGSGSTGRGAVLEGFRFIGIEKEAEYVAIARARIAAAVPPLFREAAE